MISPGELRALVADSAAVWGTPAQLAWQQDALAITTADGRTATITRAGPARWLLLAEGRRPRPCPSITALLAALRTILAPDAAPPPLRIVGG